MSSINLGRIALVLKGEWNNVFEYKRLDTVTYQGSSYVCLDDNTNKLPTNTTYWQGIAQKGDTGEKGDTGDTGEKGDTGDISGKVDKVTGKELSTNDFTTLLKNKLDAVEDEANKYIHPTTAGNKHIPAGGSVDKILKWSADGTASWEEESSGGGGLGKKYCKFVIGTSTSGYTLDDVDYLCDGTADQAEINAAIVALPASGGEIIILDGTYNITAKINLNKSNVTISGNGNSTILKRMYNSVPADGVITLTSANYCKIKDLQIDGNKATHTSSNNYGIYLNSSSNNNTVTGNTCNDNTFGIYLNYNNNNNTVTGNTCNNNTYGIVLSSSSNNNTVTGNTCNDNTYGIVLTSSSNNNTITGNTCTRGTGLPADYTASQYTIILIGTSSNYNLIATNNCMGKAVSVGGGIGNSVYGNKWDAGNDLP